MRQFSPSLAKTLNWLCSAPERPQLSWAILSANSGYNRDMEDLYLIALKALENAEKSVGLLTDLMKSLYSVDTYCRLLKLLNLQLGL